MPQKHSSYPKTEANPDFVAIEKNIQKFWEENEIFKKSVTSRDAKKGTENNEFIFYDGPPFANGLPHYGHLLTGFVKDIFARYQTIKGKKVERKFGWDTHGLPVEMATEKELGISGRTNIEKYGIEKFNDACRKSVMKYSSDWKEYVTRQARWVDFDNGYKTMDVNYMESVIWAFKELYKKGLLYEDQRVMPYSWKCQTPLSNFETRIDNAYREKESKAVTIKFKLKNHSFDFDNLSLLVWTTTAWTLPSNLAVAIGKTIDYVVVKHSNEHYIIAKSAVKKYKKDLATGDNVNIVGKISGKELIGLSYQPVFRYLTDNPGDHNLSNAFKIYAADFVNTEEGTGAVHIAPGFGEDDQNLCKQIGIPTICPVDEGGCFTYPVNEFKGQQVFETNIPIIKKLKEQDNWLKTEQYLHNYPHCWRSDTPLIYRALPSWYVKVTDFKDRMVELNQEINWIPDHIKNGLFGKWLENARDWSISRNRFWGCPVPVWQSDDPAYPRIDVYGSLDELEADFGVRPTNLHRPFIDELTRPNPDDPTGKSTMRRVTDVLDCWFESGSMPYAQAHYPFENKEWFEEHFPADFIVEYAAQTRGWFYTLMVLSTALFDRPPFKNCICHGVILDENSAKLSKRLGNYTSPLTMFEQYGADAMRCFMGASTVMRGNELNIDKEGAFIRDTLRLALKPIWNSYNFFCIYANADGINANFVTKATNILDRYILAKTKKFVSDIESALDNYDTPTAYQAINDFFEVLNNWYVRRNRSRYWKKEKDQDKQDAYDVLYSALNITVKAISPLLPHLTEEIYQGLEKDKSVSVHLQDFPDVSEINDELALVENMDKIRDICNVGLSIRSKQNIRIRQPLRKIEIIGKNYSELQDFSEMICDELNIKEIEFISAINDLAEYRLELNFKSLGKKLGKKMKEIVSEAKSGNWKKISKNEIKVKDEILTDDDFSLLLIPSKDDSMQTLSNHDGIINLDLELDTDLRREGVARDIIRLVQQSRKDAGFDISDFINLEIYTESVAIKNAVNDFSDYLKEQTLTTEIDFVSNKNGTNAYELEGEQLTINVVKL